MPSVIFFVLSAAAPLTVVAGLITTAYAVTGITGIPVAFLVVGAVLLLFSVGYVAMARRMANAGAFYAYISRGIGRPAGIGGAWIALIAYNALQIGLYGVVGAAAEPVLQRWFGVEVRWWLVALVTWAVVAVLGLLRVDINGKVLAFLLLSEIAVILVFDMADLFHPAGGQVSFDTLAPGNLLVPGVGALLVIAVLGFTGFESAVVFSEESKDPQRTVPMATYLSVIIVAGLYAFSSWAMTVATGPDQIVAASGEQEVGLIFNLAGAQMGSTIVDIGQALFLTSLLAAMISFHNTTARYAFALGRERVLPAVLGRTSPRTGAPQFGSIMQSTLGLLVILLYAVAGWDPLERLFYWGGTSGGLGVLLLIAVTAIAVVRFFLREPSGEHVWRRTIAPVLAAAALIIIVTVALINVATLLGVPPTHPLRWMVPGVYVVAALLGLLWGLVLRARRPDVYATIGMGAESITARIAQSSAVPSPRAAETSAADVGAGR
ncbi:MAG TPA: APC family permease [Micromonosporaceae bacterium]|nr:APC family permease [Micromonosporaceae bacterium]